MAELLLEPGTVISHFRLEKLLGEGGMGAVYLAEDLTLSRHVAIKFMSRSLIAGMGNPEMLKALEQRFIREAKTAAAINHPNLAQIYEANFDTENWFIAMEYIEGSPISDLITMGDGFPLKDAVDIALQTIAGLQFAWENYSIIHRDIKPQNVMLTKRGNKVKIVDLGLAKPIMDADDDMPALTGAGVPLGTPQYMAPEQATNEKDLDARADIFAVGVTLYEMCTGCKAFPGKSPPMIYMNQLQRNYEPITDHRPETPAPLVKLIEEMMDPKPESRISDYSELTYRLESVLRGLGDYPDDGGPGIVVSGTPVSAGMPSQMVLTQVDFMATDHLILDRYRIIKSIGKSGAGIVYHCLDTELKVECAVKSLIPGREFRPEHMDQILANYQRLMGFSDPHLVQIRDLRKDESSDELFVIMELLEGRNLREYTYQLRMDKESLNLDGVKQVLNRVASALDGVSAKFGLPHHDLKPESIFLIENDTQVKLLDYGVCEITLEADPGASRGKATFNYIANPDYMAPELWHNDANKTAIDQYSLGLIVFEILERRLPFWLHEPYDDLERTPDERVKLQRFYDRVHRETPAAVPELSRKQNAVLQRALAKSPDDRFPDCRSFIRALSRADVAGLLLKGAAAVVLFGIAILLATVSLDNYLENKERNKNLDRPTTKVTPTNSGIGVDGTWTGMDPGGIDIPTAADPGVRAKEQERLARMLADRYTGLRKNVSAWPLPAADLDPITKAAEAAVADLEAGEFEKAAVAYASACTDLTKLVAAFRAEMQGKLKAMSAAVSVKEDEIRPYLGLSPGISATRAKIDAGLASIRVAADEDDFVFALEEYRNVLTLYDDVAKTGKRLFLAAPGKNWSIPRLGIELIWAESLGMWIGKYEITNDQFRQYKPRHDSKSFDGFSLNKATQPVAEVSFYDAVGFCQWLNMRGRREGYLPKKFEYRIPGAKEWMTFARQGRECLYPWGNEWPPAYGNFANQEMFQKTWQLDDYNDPFPVTCPVKKSGVGPWGLYGLAGNLWEWTTKRFEGDDDNEMDKRAVLGGAWASTNRLTLLIKPLGNNYARADRTYDNVGFRILLAPVLDDKAGSTDSADPK